jgi:hypothetical protein
MPTYPIQIKRSGTAASAPSSLAHGELALNYADKVLYFKDASNVIQSFTFQSYALASHTHAASDITSGTLDAARLPLATTLAAGAVIVGTGLGVSSGTVSVTYGTTSGTACQGNDSRLSDARTPTSHAHGNISNAGAIGATANLPVITTTSGVLTTGTFGTSASSFCEGNDARLSDTRTPTDNTVSTAKIQNDAVTYAKIQNVSATDRLLGRSSAGAGDVEEITCTSFGRSVISSADSAAARTTLGVQPTASPTFTGNARVNSSDSATSLLVNGATKGVRFATSSTATAIEGVDSTGTGSYQPLIINGSTVTIQSNGGTSAITVSTSQTATFAGQIVGQAGAAISGGAVTVTSPLVLTGTVAGNVRQLRMQTSGSTRWEVGPGFDAESGSNVGSTLWITRWSDSGVFLGTPISIARATGVVTFESQVLVNTGSGSSGSYKPGMAISGDDDTGLMQTTSGGANTLSLVTAGNERVRVDASGAVGIGMTPTSLPLSAFSFATSDANKATLLLSGTVGSGQSFAGIRFSHNVFTTGWGADILCVDTGNFGGILSFRTSATGSATATPTERMLIDASGNVGIGVTPTQRLHVVRSGTGIAARFTDNSTQTLDIGVTASAGVYYDNPNSGYHEWQIGGSGKMRLTGGAELLIGTTTDNGAYLLQVNSQIYATNATIATSDARFKTNIESLTDATSVIESLRPVAFDFIPQEDRNFATERQVGLIAQEAEAALAGIDYADSVVAQCGDHLGLAYEKLVPVLIKALQESNARIAALEERING